MNKKEVLAVCLSQEELFVILAYLKIRALMGLDVQILANATTEQRELALQVAERSLIARSFLIPDDQQKLKLDPTILAIIVASAMPEYTLMLTRVLPGKPIEPYFFHTHRQMAVVHTIPLSGIHQFLAVNGKQALAQSALSVLALGVRAAPPGKTNYLLQGQVTTARQLAIKQGIAIAQSMLVDAGLDALTAEQFALALANPVANTTLVAKHHDADMVSSVDGFTILQGHNGLWLLKPTDAVASEKISLRPVSSQEAIDAYKQLVI